MKGSKARILRPKGHPKTILMPAEICIYRDETCTQFVQAMQALSVSALSHQRPVILDLSQTKHITAGAAVMLFAEVTRAQLITGVPDIVTIERPKDKAMWQLIRNSGLWDAIRPGGEKKLDSLWEKNCPFASGNDPSIHLAPTLKTFREARPNLPERFDSAIQEAILNVVHHAYHYNQQQAVEALGTRWWQYACITPEDVRFTICDLGIGIPTKISFSRDHQGLSDADCIKQAMENGFSTLKQRGRGLGSKDLKRPVDKTEAEALSIFSNNGLYSYLQDRPLRLSDRPACLPGTVVEWKMTLPA